MCTIGMARLLPQYANLIRMPPRLRSWPIAVRKRRRRRLLGQRGLGLLAPPTRSEIALVPWSALRRPPREPAPGREALVWRALLAAGAVANRAALARWRGVSRARVTQVLRLLG